jgi:hypothetical protein
MSSGPSTGADLRVEASGTFLCPASYLGNWAVSPFPRPPAAQVLRPRLRHLAGVFARGRNLPLLIGLRQQWAAASPFSRQMLATEFPS